MKKRSRLWWLVLLAGVLLQPCRVAAQGEVVFPDARRSGGVGLLTTLQRRRSTHDFAERKIPWDVIGNMLWAGYGINRWQSGQRTAPSFMNWREIEIYLLAEEGVWRYDAEAHRLVPIRTGDFRRLAGKGAHVMSAPMSLLFVADTSRMLQGLIPLSEREMHMAAGMHVGHITQNIHLFGASEGLGVVINFEMNRTQGAETLQIPEHKMLVASQTIGYPAE